jgi:hypothetical protein
MAARRTASIKRSPLPSAESVKFRDSTFFRHHETLPTTDEIRAASQASGKVGHPDTPPPVPFPAMNLIVKFGRYVTIAEGQCLTMTKSCLQNTVPVPEVYGWCKHGEDVLIYMQLISGVTLKERWESLLVEEKNSISEELRVMMVSLRQLVQSPQEPYVGKLFSSETLRYVTHYKVWCILSR